MLLDFTPKLLIVDDREENLQLLKAMLGKMDVELDLVQSPLKALQCVEREEYALIILDIQMPQMDGFLLAEKIRHGGQNKSTPIIFLTAVFLDKESELKGYKCGCVDFISKPFDSVILINKVNVFLDLYNARKLKEEQNQKLSLALSEKGMLESRLRNLASNYRSILEGQAEIIFKTDGSLRIEFANKAFSNFFDYSQDGISTDSLSTISPELFLQLKPEIEAMNGKKRITVESEICGNQSERKWMEWLIFKEVEFDDVHFLFVGRNITQTKRLNDTLINKENLLQKIQKEIGVGSWNWDSYSRILTGSDEFYRLYEINNMEDENIFDLIKAKTHPDDREAIVRLILNLPKKNQKLQFQHRYLLSDGGVKHFKVILYSEFDKEDDILKLNGICIDISQDKFLEYSLRENLGQEVDSLNKSVFELDRTYRLTYLNKFGCEFLECDNFEEIKNTDFSDFFRANEKDKILKTLDFSGQKKELVIEYFTLITKRNKLKKVILLAIPIIVNNLQIGVKGVVVNLSDQFVTDESNGNSSEKFKEIILGMKRQEKEFEASSQELKEKVEEELKLNEFQRQLLIKKSELESLGRMASSIVHEINQPLSAISMVMDNILLRLSKNKFDEKYLKEKCFQVFSDIDRIKKYLSQIGIYNSTQKEESVESVNVYKVVRDSLDLISKQHKNCEVEIKFNHNVESFCILGNKYKLQKALIDILNNSFESIAEKVRFLNHKKSKEWIEVSIYAIGKEVVISIKDSGGGISSENLNYIFEPFFTTKQSGIGSGLSLYICEGIIQKMNGEIKAYSKKDEFMEMKLIFPLESEKEEKEVNFKKN